MKAISTLAAAFLLIMISESCTESKGNHPLVPKKAEPVPVKVISLEKTTHESTIKASGHITTNDETTLSFKVGGVVRKVYAEEGQKVKRGELLAVLDLTEIDGLVLQARSAFEKAQRDLSRAQNLYKDSVATLEQLQNARTAFDVAESQLKTAEFDRGFSEIKAQSSGFVLQKFVNPGQLVKPGDPVFRTNGAGSGKWVLKSGVSDKQWTTIQEGDKAIVEVDAFPGKTFPGVVIRKAEASDPATGAFTIEIEVNQGSLRFASGMFASASILSKIKTSMWDVPYEAVLDASGNEGFVFVTNDGKTAERKQVVIGSFDGKTIQISQGLEDADLLIVAGSAYLTENSPISIVK